MNRQEQENQFNQLLEAHRERLYRLCRANAYERASVDDLYQEVLMNIWKSLPKYKGDAQIYTWIYRITINTAITFNTRQIKRKERDQLGINQPNDEGQNVHPQLEELYAIIQQLKADERWIISLFLEDLSYQEIADVVGISINLVGVRLNRIKAKMKKLSQ